MATVEEIKNKYQSDAVAAKLAPPSKIPIDIAMSALQDLKSGKGNKPIPKDFVLLVAQNAYDWASKDKKFVDEWNTADHMGKVRLFKRYSAEYVKKFKYAIANGMKQRGLLDSVDELRIKYMMDAPSKKELENYYRFLVVAEGMDGKLIRTPKSYFGTFEEAMRTAKSLQKPTTHHVFIEGERSDHQMGSKALYQWRNPKGK